MMKLTVYSKPIPVKTKPGMLDDGELGEYCSKTNSICVDSTIKGDELIYTLLHELIHATCDVQGFHNMKLSDDLEEILAHTIPRVIQENFTVRLKCKKKNAK